MVERPLNWNPPDELTDEWRAHVDSLYPSPADQANTILEQIHDPFDDTWALIFFAIETLGNIALPMFGHGAPIAQRICEVGRDFYALHYFKAPELYGLQRVTKEEVDENGILKVPQTNLKGPDVSEPSSDGSNGSP
jgi:hypothetical protein